MTDVVDTIVRPQLDPFTPAATLTSDGIAAHDAVKLVVPLLRTEALEGEANGALTDLITENLTAIGVFDLGTPIEFGGLASGARDLVEILSAVGSGDGSAGWLAATGANNNVLALAYPDEAVEEVYTNTKGWKGPRVIAASLFARRVGQAFPVDGGWHVNGKWGFGTGCHHAAWAIVGADFVYPDGRPGRGLALLSRHQYHILDDWKVTGMSATSSNTIESEGEVFVPDHRFIDLAFLQPNLEALRGRYEGGAFTWGATSRLVVVTLNLAAVALGLAEGALECFVEQAEKRKPFNLPYETVADSPGTQITAGRTRAAIDVARATVERVADGIDRLGAAGRDLNEQESNRIHMELVYAIRLCEEAVGATETAIGSSVALLKNPIQRFARDIRVLSSHGAIRFDPLAELSGRDVLNREPTEMFAAGLPATA